MTRPIETNAKVQIAVAGVTAIATILAAFLGVVPQLRQADQQQIKDLNSKLVELQNRIPAEQASDYVLSGYLRTKGHNVPVTNAIAVAAPAGNSATLDSEGKFVLPKMANQYYDLLVQTQDGKIIRVTVDPTGAETEANNDELALTYSLSKE